MPSSTKFDGLKRIVCIGRDARYNRAIIDLNWPSPGAQRKLMVIERDADVEIMRGYRPEEACYIPMSPTPYQLDFLASRRHERISIEEATEWLKNFH